MTEQKEPVGIEDFKKIRTRRTSEGNPLPYCDKTMLIKDVIDSGDEVLLFTRPRRFGKSLNLTMLKYFFGTKEPLFEGLKIAAYQNIMENYRDFPVVLINLKDMKFDNAKECAAQLKKIIAKVHNAFTYLHDSPALSPLVRKRLIRCSDEEMATSDIPISFQNLTEALLEHHGKQVIVLIDEYDSPLQEAYMENCLDPVLKFIRPMLGKLLKGNDALFKGVVTGISRVSKENIFSGLNNPGMYDIGHNSFAEYFGFTEDEVKAMVDPDDLEDVRAWYNGYTFGDDTVIYNPWSIISFLKDKKFDPYWINSSGNDLIKQSLTADKMQDVKILMERGSIEMRYDPYIVLRDLKTNDFAFWNLMYTSGYLTSEPTDRFQKKRPPKMRMHIPNEEVHAFFEDCVKGWFGNGKGARFLERFCEALLLGDTRTVHQILQDAVFNTIGHDDVSINKEESFYHGLLLGITLQLKDRYDVQSNRQGGFGRYDIALTPANPKLDPGIIIEVKTRDNVKSGLTQIEENAYYAAFVKKNCTPILYGMRFSGLHVEVVKAGEDIVYGIEGAEKERVREEKRAKRRKGKRKVTEN